MEWSCAEWAIAEVQVKVVEIASKARILFADVILFLLDKNYLNS
tara:strand:+ start:889 stop:1020 length:132 start_codon:yes stop_codon:yes gene_type:complete